MSRRPATGPGPGANPRSGAPPVDVLLDDLDDLDAVPAAAASAERPPRPRRPRRRALLVAGVAAGLTALVATSSTRHQERAAAAASAAAESDAAPLTAWEQEQQRAAEHAAQEVDALSQLPEDLATDQQVVVKALAGAAPRLVDLDWSLARTSTRRDGAQRTAQGAPVLVDAARFARTTTSRAEGGAQQEPVRVPPVLGQYLVVPAAGAGPATGVGWRITTPLRPQGPLDPCSAAGALPLPRASAGAVAPECRLQTFTSASGEQQAVAVRTWEQLVDSPGAASPARVEVVHQAVLVTDGRWTWSVAASAVGRPGARAAVPPMSLDQVVLATRWLADAARGLPTPAPLDGTPLPGFSG